MPMALSRPTQMMLGVALVAAMLASAWAEDKEEEKVVSKTSMVVCIMLLGTVGSTIGAFYLVNHSDKDIQYSTWNVICNTISIFAAVLVFQAVQGLVEYYFLEGAGTIKTVIVCFMHQVAWFTVLQVFLALVSRAVVFPFVPLTPLPEEDGQDKEKLQEVIELDMKCWGILFGHITGFASINFWCTVQELFKHSLVGSFLVIPAATFSLWVMFRITDMVREAIALGDDGVKDKQEELWDEEVEETERDVRALALSFLSVQWARFAIFGKMPNLEGDLEIENYTDTKVWALVGFSVIAIVVGNFPNNFFLKRCLHEHESIESMQNTLNFIFAWCLMFAFQAYLAGHGLLQSDASGEVFQAVILTWATFAATHGLDFLADLESTGEETDDAIRSLIATLGVLVGFSWEKCFDISVDNIAVKVEAIPQPVTKMGIAVFLVLSVLPAWRWYILPVMTRLKEESKELERQSRIHRGSLEEANTYRALPGNDGKSQVAHHHEHNKGLENVEEVQKLQDQAEELGELLRKATSENETLRSEAAKSAEAYRGRVKELKSRMAQIQVQAQQMEGSASQTVQQSADQVASLTQQLHAAGTAFRASEQRHAELEAEKQQLNVQIGEMRAQLGQVAATQAEKQQLSAQIGEVGARLGHVAAEEAEKQQLHQQNTELKMQLEAAMASQAEKDQVYQQRLKLQLETAMTSQAEKDQLYQQNSQLKMLLETATDSQASLGMRDARIQELEAQLQAESAAQESLQATIQSLHEKLEERSECPGIARMANDDLNRMLRGLTRGSSAIAARPGGRAGALQPPGSSANSLAGPGSSPRIGISPATSFEPPSEGGQAFPARRPVALRSPASRPRSVQPQVPSFYQVPLTKARVANTEAGLPAPMGPTIPVGRTPGQVPNVQGMPPAFLRNRSPPTSPTMQQAVMPVVPGVGPPRFSADGRLGRY